MCSVAVMLLCLGLAAGKLQELQYCPSDLIDDPMLELIRAPRAGEWAAWLKNIQKWRNDCHKKVGYNGSIYDVPQLKWTQTSYVQPQSHTYDRYFYDETSGYTVKKWLGDLNERYGGIDSVLLWPTYTNIGIDTRNQLDYVRALPGGINGTRKVVQELKSNGVRVLWPYNPWDIYTRDEGSPDYIALDKLIKDTDADG